MLVLKRLLLYILILGFMIAIGFGVYAHLVHDVKIPDLSFTSDPKIACNIDGKYFIRNIATDGVGKVLSDVWSPEPIDPIVSLTAEAHGIGWAHVLFHGSIDGVPFGDAENTTPDRMGNWIGFAPIWWKFGSPNQEIKVEHEGDFNRDPKRYSWNATGTIELVPIYWDWKLMGENIGGSWKEASEKFCTTKSDTSEDDKEWWEVMKSVASIPNITYNKTVFAVYETLEVTVQKTDLYVANMYIDNNLVQSTYANGGQVVLRKTWHTGDIGIRNVKIVLYFGDEGEHSTIRSSCVTVK